MSVPYFAHFFVEISANMSVIDLYTGLTAPLPESAAVLATARVGWPLPTVKAKVVFLYHENPMLLDQGFCIWFPEYEVNEVQPEGR
jgi:hypothetical protein